MYCILLSSARSSKGGQDGRWSSLAGVAHPATDSRMILLSCMIGSYRSIVWLLRVQDHPPSINCCAVLCCAVASVLPYLLLLSLCASINIPTTSSLKSTYFLESHWASPACETRLCLLSPPHSLIPPFPPFQPPPPPYLVTWIPSGVRHPINNLQAEIINRGTWELRAEEIKRIQTRYWKKNQGCRNTQEPTEISNCGSSAR